MIFVIKTVRMVAGRDTRLLDMKIAVIGLGFVGLTLSSVLASKGIRTVGIDLDKEKCSKIAKGEPTFFEPNLKKTLKKALKKNLLITDKLSSISNCDFIFITVGTPQRKNGEIDLSFIKTVVRSCLLYTSPSPRDRG